MGNMFTNDYSYKTMCLPHGIVDKRYRDAYSKLKPRNNQCTICSMTTDGTLTIRCLILWNGFLQITETTVYIKE